MLTTSRLLCVSILIVSGLAKLITASMEFAALHEANPVFYFLSQRQFFLVFGFAELVVALITLRANVAKSLFILLPLAFGFLAYRFALYYGKFAVSCDCLGYAGYWAGVSKKNTEIAGGFIAITFLFCVLHQYYCILKRSRILDESYRKESV